MAIRCDHCGEEADLVSHELCATRREGEAWPSLFYRDLLLCPKCTLPLRDAVAAMVAEFTGDAVKA